MLERRDREAVATVSVASNRAENSNLSQIYKNSGEAVQAAAAIVYEMTVPELSDRRWSPLRARWNAAPALFYPLRATLFWKHVCFGYRGLGRMGWARYTSFFFSPAAYSPRVWCGEKTRQNDFEFINAEWASECYTSGDAIISRFLRLGRWDGRLVENCEKQRDRDLEWIFVYSRGEKGRVEARDTENRRVAIAVLMD